MPRFLERLSGRIYSPVIKIETPGLRHLKGFFRGCHYILGGDTKKSTPGVTHPRHATDFILNKKLKKKHSNP